MRLAKRFFSLSLAASFVTSSLDVGASEPPAIAPAPRESKRGAVPNPDAVAARLQRWTLRFQVADGHDYVAQLKSLNAKLLLPHPEGGKCILITDLDKPEGQKTVNPDDFVAEHVRFVDSRKRAVDEVVAALGLKLKPESFCAVFPKKMENQLLQLERDFKNRREEDIAETIFRIEMRDGSPEITVVEQKVKP